MQQIMNIWTGLEMRKRVIVVLATLAMFAAILGLGRMASTPSMALLYSGLESGAAGEVIGALEQRGVAYDVRGGSIFVDVSQRDALRMTLASEGLPANSARGYELLDSLSGFGTTSQMFDAAYWRAKEGELSRTLVSSPNISAARVHLANTGSNPFQRDVTPSASVMVTAAGGGIPAKQAQAIRYLVASAVPGMTPDDVSVIDSSGGLVSAESENRPNAGEDLSETLRQRVHRLLEARVGRGNAVVELSVDTVTTTEMIRERTIDPNSRVAISTDTEERTNSSSDQGGGDVTVASNLPDGDGAGGDNSSSQTNETRERVNYEVSQTEREVTLAPGAVKRLTVAVLVNGSMQTDASGTARFVPRSEDELSALRELVASAVGFDEARGDVITIKTMEFQPLVVSGTEAAPTFLAGLGLDVMSLIQALVLGLVALVLGLFVVRPVLAAAPAGPTPQLAAPEAATAGTAAASGSPRTPESVPETITPLTGEIDDGDVDPSAMSLVQGGSADRDAGMPSLPQGEDPVTRLRNMIGERQEETVEILRTWLEGEEEKA